MTQAISYEQIILENVKNLTLQQQQEVLDFIAFLKFKGQKQEISEKEEKVISMLEAAKEFVGCLESGVGGLSLKKLK
ncbi:MULTISPECIES: hypothetical protein [Okeania]|uniref:DUF2281 domain-containing protein n=1 Tax=Okeania hirsuta TaxID=1458930 RepID=A0A3N6RI34_9CYAN|nr:MULTISPECIES: hypothetical protein [Okeania]NET13465.1 hypothetical protein [Okeania sp. SIO1H6]NES75578.1 hypothetical protein [Okeania sp. SIO1H4]NES91585.1 hypothetical protein [Okeania sp. SIO2B9]NET18007.1 hypothetical protein [Okeania sp. SIO1H5]NET76136.1 hypothetical protein [Okeania sp. SIO1F9]